MILKYLLLLLVVGTATIHACKPCDKTGTVITDSPEYSFETQFRALFFKPGANNLYYAAEAFPFDTAIPDQVISPHWNIYDVHPTYRFGFDVGFRTVFHTRQSSLYANWEHFQSTTSQTALAVSTPTYPNPMMGPFSSIGPDAAGYDIAAQGCVSFYFNEVNLRYGQYVIFGDYLETNFFGGISFADLHQEMRSSYTGTGDIAQVITVPTSFIGAGPQFGFDFSYDIVKGLNFTGQVTTALLMGTGKNHTNYASFSPLLAAGGDPVPNLQNTCVQNKMKVVPSLSERLGLAYFLPFRNHYMAKLEVGFEAKIFLNAFESTNLASGVIDVTPYDNTVGVFARTFERTVSSFSLSGPYIAFSMAL